MLNINFYFYNIRLVAKKSELKVHEKVWQTYPKFLYFRKNQSNLEKCVAKNF